MANRYRAIRSIRVGVTACLCLAVLGIVRAQEPAAPAGVRVPSVIGLTAADARTLLAEVGLAAIEAGADDVQVEGKSIDIATAPNIFEKVKAAVEALPGVMVENAEVTMQPKQTVSVGEDKAVPVLRLMESLEEDDDVQQVYANFDIPADVLERVSAQV